MPEQKNIHIAPVPANVLLVDDRPEGLMALEAVLSSPELNLVKAVSGRDALAKLPAYDFAVILLDVQMPGIDGFDTARIIRQNEWSKNVPIIFVTAINLDQKHVFKGYECGAVDYLFKPLDPFVLKSKVGIFVELYRRNQKIKEQSQILRDQTQELLKMNAALQAEMKERQRAEREVLAISNREQSKLGRELHDGLCQQLTGIAFMIKRIQQGLPPELGKNGEELSDQVRKAISETTQLARGLNPLCLETNSLIPALQDLASNVAALFSVRCRFEGDPDIAIEDPGVSINLYRIAQEAIHNAVKHGKAKEIWVRISRMSGGKIRLTVEDNGVGLNGQNGLSDGMGLRNMKYRAGLIGSSFEIRSHPGEGTLVECIFDEPQPRKQDAVAPSSNGKVEGDNVDRKKFLLVEDHPVVRRWIKEVINNEPDLVVCGETDDINEAYEMVERLKPNVALVDISLKDANGLDLVRKISSEHSDVLTLVVSMHDEKAYAEKALQAGARGYARKEDAAENLVMAFRQIMSGKLYVSGQGQAIIDKFEQEQISHK